MKFLFMYKTTLYTFNENPLKFYQAKYEFILFSYPSPSLIPFKSICSKVQGTAGARPLLTHSRRPALAHSHSRSRWPRPLTLTFGWWSTLALTGISGPFPLPSEGRTLKLKDFASFAKFCKLFGNQ